LPAAILWGVTWPVFLFGGGGRGRRFSDRDKLIELDRDAQLRSVMKVDRDEDAA
jgi:hypothetical protein